MAWSENARRAAAEARRRGARQLWSDARVESAKAKSASNKLLKVSLRKRLATAIRNYRAGRTEGGYGGGANTPRSWMKQATLSTRLRNHFRRKIDRARARGAS